MIHFFFYVLLYFFASLILGWIPVNPGFHFSEEGIDIYISSNGVHTDFILPIETKQVDWKNFFNRKDFGRIFDKASYIAFGWGDKGFYLNTPEWKDLTFNTAVIALLVPSESAMHVTLWGKPVEDELTKKLRLSEDEYLTLVEYIRNSFETDRKGKPVKILHPGYGNHDLFYRSVYHFHLFKTCNIWTNQGMKETGIRTGMWCPFDRAILYQISKIRE